MSRKRLSLSLPCNKDDESSNTLKKKVKHNVRSKYHDNAPDYAALANLYPSLLSEFVNINKNGHARINWSDALANIAVQKTLLLHDFQLNCELPIDRLCPTVPSRANYIHWLQDLLALSPASETPRRGIDIGTGASCIYPLLGARIAGWHFVATEIDADSLSCAQRNVASNSLSDSIEVRFVPERKRLLTNVIIQSDGTFDFCMCNPPFYSSEQEAREAKYRDRRAISSELYCDGGEEAFTAQLVDESLQFHSQIRWFTTLAGKKKTLRKLLGKLREKNVKNICTHELLQGTTSRWVIGWSFFNDGLPSSITQKIGESKTKFSVENEKVRIAALRAKADIRVFGRKKEAEKTFRRAGNRIYKFTALCTPSESKQSNFDDSAEMIPQGIAYIRARNHIYSLSNISDGKALSFENEFEKSRNKNLNLLQCILPSSLSVEADAVHNLTGRVCLQKDKNSLSEKEKCFDFSLVIAARQPDEQNADNVTIQISMTTGALEDVCHFQDFCTRLANDVMRTNRWWRRFQKRQMQ
eukprot:g5275.t1